MATLNWKDYLAKAAEVNAEGAVLLTTTEFSRWIRTLKQLFSDVYSWIITKAAQAREAW